MRGSFDPDQVREIGGSWAHWVSPATAGIPCQPVSCPWERASRRDAASSRDAIGRRLPLDPHQSQACTGQTRLGPEPAAALGRRTPRCPNCFDRLIAPHSGNPMSCPCLRPSGCAASGRAARAAGLAALVCLPLGATGFDLPPGEPDLLTGKDINGVCAGCHGDVGQGGEEGQCPTSPASLSLTSTDRSSSSSRTSGPICRCWNMSMSAS